MEVRIKINDSIEENEVVELYQANGWSSAEKPKLLLLALENSHTLVTARIDDKLVGIGNAISDGYLVVYYPHILVHPAYQSKGIGSKIMQAMQSIYKEFHQQMLTADINVIEFYKTVGFEPAVNTQSMWIYEGNDH
ncbi:MAG: GNAT family N-acetyltransferase [Candidatus Thiodiazotropha sp.]